MRGISFIAVSLLLCITHGADAQLREFEITSVPPSGPIPVFRNHPDKVAIIIRSSMSNLRFDSNLGITANFSDPAKGEYVILVDPVRQSVTVNAPGFQQGRFQVSLSEPRQVAYFRVEPRPDVATLVIPANFQVTPADAVVTIDGIVVDITRPVPIEAGTHLLRIEKTGYRPVERQIQVNAGQNLFQETLTAIEPVAVTVRTGVAGASVLLDAVEVGVTDRNGDVGFYRLPGSYGLQVVMSGYLTHLSTLLVTESGQNELRLDLIRNTGILRFQVDPADAQVLVNRRPYPSSQPIELAPGVVRVEVSRADHDPYSETIEVIRGETVFRTVSLEPHMGMFRIRPNPLQSSWNLTDPSGRVVMSGTGLNQQPAIKAGTYTLRVSAPGYQDEVRTVRIAKDASADLDVTLREAVRSASRPEAKPREDEVRTDRQVRFFVSIGGQSGALSDFSLTRRMDYSQLDGSGNRREFTSDFELLVNSENGIIAYPQAGLGLSLWNRIDVSATFGLYRVSIDNPSGLFSTSLDQPYVTINSVDLKSVIRLVPSRFDIQPIVGVSLNNRWLSSYENFAYNSVTRDYNRVKANLSHRLSATDLIAGVDYVLDPFRASLTYRFSMSRTEFVPFLGAELTWVF